MDIVQLYSDFGVDFVTEGHKHSRPGWANVECPFCTGNPGYHLGFELHSNFFYCWRCGWHSTIPTISKLLNIPEKETRKLIPKYGLLVPKIRKDSVDKIVRTKAHRLPSNVEPLGNNHLKYLEGRGFDPEELVHLWNISGTGPFSQLDRLNFKHRIIIPIIWDDKEVSFTSRDITNRHPLKYISCPKDRELIEHKRIVYGRQQNWQKTGICVEGPTDVWRLGVHAFATFGIKWVSEQVRLIARNFERVAVIYDDENEAEVQAQRLISELRFRKVDAFRVPIEGDPGSMKQDEANHLVNQIIKPKSYAVD